MFRILALEVQPSAKMVPTTALFGARMRASTQNLSVCHLSSLSLFTPPSSHRRRRDSDCSNVRYMSTSKVPVQVREQVEEIIRSSKSRRSGKPFSDGESRTLLQRNIQLGEIALHLIEENKKLQAEKLTLTSKLEEAEKQASSKKSGGIFSAFSKYGLPFVFWWSSVYVTTGIGIYAAISGGLFGGADVVDLIQGLGVDKYIDTSKLNPQYGNFLLAVLVNELVEPLRFPLCLATTPYVLNTFRKMRGQPPKTF